MIALVIILFLCGLCAVVFLIDSAQDIEEHNNAMLNLRMREIERKLDAHLRQHEHRDTYGP